jgi:hypothetical protein
VAQIYGLGRNALPGLGIGMLVSTVACAAVGFLLANAAGPGFVSLVVAGSAAMATFTAALFLTGAAELEELRRLVRLARGAPASRDSESQ